MVFSPMTSYPSPSLRAPSPLLLLRQAPLNHRPSQDASISFNCSCWYIAVSLGPVAAAVAAADADADTVPTAAAVAAAVARSRLRPLVLVQSL